jgi:polar amino acid transport system substrate-binding protein
MRIQIFGVIAFVSLIMGATIMAENAYAKKPIIIGMAGWTMPFAEEKEAKEGILIEVVTAAFKARSIRVKHEFFKRKVIEAQLLGGGISAINGWWKNEKRKVNYHFSESYLKNELYFYKNIQSKEPLVRSLTQLKQYTQYAPGKAFGMVSRYIYHPTLISLLKNGTSWFYTSTFIFKDAHVLFDANIKGINQLMGMDPIIANWGIRSYKNNIRLLQSKKPFFEEPLHLMSLRANPKGRWLIDNFNKGLRTIKKNGTYQKILDKYFVGHKNPKILKER